MPRVSRAQTALNHQRVVEIASRMVREHGANGVSVPELMNGAGLTHGGFYKHFKSKEELIATAGRAAFVARLAELHHQAELGVDTPETASVDDIREAFLDRYLSASHRDNPGAGCAAAALAADASHADPGSPLREAYTDGIRQMVLALKALEPQSDAGTVAAARPRLLVDVATLVGTILLARATAGSEISDELLEAARRHFLDQNDKGA